MVKQEDGAVKNSSSLKNRKIDRLKFNRIKQLLLLPGITQTDIAQAEGITQPVVHNIKNFVDYESFSKKDDLVFRRDGFIYLVKSGKYHKIGITSNLQKRIYSYECHNPNLVFCTSGLIKKAGYIEQELHKKFFSKRKVRDWYIFNKKDIKFIEKVLSSGEF